MATVKVEIEVEERVVYHRYLEMDEADFMRINQTFDSGDRKAIHRVEEEVRCMLDPYRDLTDSKDMEVTTFKLQQPS